MFCSECGQKLNDGAKFCSGCGKPVQQVNSNTANNPGEPAGEKSKKGFSSFFNLGKKDEGGKPPEAEKTTSIVLPDMVEDSIEARYAAITSDGKYLVFKDDSEDKLQIMDTQSGKITMSVDWNGENSYPSITISPDGNYVVICGVDLVSMINTQTGEETELEHGVNNGPAIFSEDNKRLAYVPNRHFSHELKIINIPKGNELLSLKGDFFVLAYSPDGRYLATYSYDGTILWDAHNGSQLAMLGDRNEGAGTTSSIIFSPDGNRIVTAAQGRVIRIWDSKSRAMLYQFGEYQEEYGSEEGRIRISPDGKSIIVCYYGSSAEYEDGAIQIINAETGKLLKELRDGENAVEWASYTPDGKKLVTYSGRKVKFWVGEQ